MTRIVLCLGIAAVLACGAAATAHASYTPYWGYNNLTRTNPPAGTCPGQGAAFACSGFNDTPPHDSSALEYSSGDAQVEYGYQNCAGCTRFAFLANSGPGHYEVPWFTVLDYYPNLNTNYNRLYCAHYTNQNTYAYIQCRFGTF